MYAVDLDLDRLAGIPVIITGACLRLRSRPPSRHKTEREKRGRKGEKRKSAEARQIFGGEV